MDYDSIKLDKMFLWLEKLPFEVWLPEKAPLTEEQACYIEFIMCEGHDSLTGLSFNNDFTKIIKHKNSFNI